MCRTKPVRVQAVELTGEEADPEPSQESPSYRVSSMTNQESDTHPLFIAALEGSGDSWRVPITTNGSIVTYKVDTGAQVNVLPRHIYQQLQHKPALKPTQAKIMAYGSDKALPLEGQCVCQVNVRPGVSRHLQFYVVSVAAEPILGFSACQDLQLIKLLCSTDVHNLPASPVEEANPIPVTDPVATSYVDLFQGVGLLHGYPHTITLQETATPHVVASPRRIPYPLMTKVKDELDRMLTAGIMEEVVEPTQWVSPMVPVLKKDGKVRICVDFTELNQCVQRERFQLPVAEDLFAKMHGARYFTTLDAASGFWQIPLSPDCSSLTTFITQFGRYRFTRLPFGITSGPEVFHCVNMKTMLHDIEGTDCFIDDIVIWGATPDEHDQRLRQVLDRCRENGSKLNQSKCFFRRTEVKYFSHILTGHGIRADVDKLRAVVSMQRPHTREELQRYMGMIAYLAKFLPNNSQVSAPLRTLLRDDTPWMWTPAQEEAYQKLQAMVTSPPVLAFYSSDAATTVSADASSYGIGAVLLQIQRDGRKAPVAYVFRALTPTEQRYSQIEKEALAMAWACEKFECYLLGQPTPFLVETDHKPLQTIMNMQHLDQCPPRLP